MENIEESLLQLLKCNICLDEKDQLKVLPCQHTFCLECVKQLATRQSRFRCPVCNKEHRVPEDGFEQLPDNLVAKQLADLVKERKDKHDGGELEETAKAQLAEAMDDEDGAKSKETEVLEEMNMTEEVKVTKDEKDVAKLAANESTDKPSSSSKKFKRQNKKKAESSEPDVRPKDSPTDVTAGENEEVKDDKKDIDVPKLKRDLSSALNSARQWHRKAECMTEHHSKLLVDIPEGVEATRDAIKAYQQRTVTNCGEQLKGVRKGSRDSTSEIEEKLIEIQPETDQMNDALKGVPQTMKKLSNKKCSLKTVSEAEQLLQKLKTFNASVTRSHCALDSTRQIKAGDSVRLIFSAKEDIQTFVNGKVTSGSIGIFRGQLKEKRHNKLIPQLPLVTRRNLVIFPEKFDWRGPIAGGNLVKSYTKVNLPFKGDRVRVKSTAIKSDVDWEGRSTPKSRGVLVSINDCHMEDDLSVIVDFPEWSSWCGRYSEIELVPGCGLEVGDKVWVNRSIPEPSRGWAGVNGSSVGKIKHVQGQKGQEEVTVDFPECMDWIGLATDLEFVREPRTEEQVQVKLSVEKPKLDWGGVTHNHVGELTEILDDPSSGRVAQIKFPKRPLWSCMLEEVEPARYQPLNYDSEQSEEGEEDGDAVSLLDVMLHMFGQMVE